MDEPGKADEETSLPDPPVGEEEYAGDEGYYDRYCGQLDDAEYMRQSGGFR